MANCRVEDGFYWRMSAAKTLALGSNLYANRQIIFSVGSENWAVVINQSDPGYFVWDTDRLKVMSNPCSTWWKFSVACEFLTPSQLCGSNKNQKYFGTAGYDKVLASNDTVVGNSYGGGPGIRGRNVLMAGCETHTRDPSNSSYWEEIQHWDYGGTPSTWPTYYYRFWFLPHTAPSTTLVASVSIVFEYTNRVKFWVDLP